MGRLTGPERTFERGDVLRLEGSPNPELYMLRGGWLVCGVGLDDGSRQISKVHLPGDLVGMPSMASPEAAETITAMTSVTVEIVTLETFGRVFRDHPRFAGLVLLWAQEERVNLMTQVTLLGRMQGPRRVGAFLLGLYRRCRLNDPDLGSFLPLPLSQPDLADATGMTAVHVNRSLSALRKRGLLTWQKGGVLIHDVQALEAFAHIPPSRPRRTDWL